MTMPSERLNSIKRARDFLRDLLDPKKTKRVPREVRRQAYSCLRHYPSDYDMERAAEDYKSVFGISKKMKSQIKDWVDELDDEP